MLSPFSPDFLFRLIAFLIAIVLHELAHGLVAYWLGDPTAKRAGRLTLNPIVHIDPLGLILILFGPFGWAKPIPVNTSYLRCNKRLGIALVSLAGPVTNLLLAMVSAWGLIYYVTHSITMGSGSAVFKFLEMCVQINAILAIFNLLPIPPLDGSKILVSLLPRRFYGAYLKYETFGPFILLFLVITPLASAVIYPLNGLLYRWLGLA